ncbi:MAG: hypothetical protein P4L53_11505 [Candidatus Obscuribacterales bacterium]|nr:hypothetical protein [Candidatus Obscuribacterales bacterium]
MSRTAGPEVSVGRMEKPPEGHQEAQLASGLLFAESQQLRFDAPLSISPDNQNQNADVQAMLGGFGIVNSLAKNDNLLANPDVAPQSYSQFTQNDGPLNGANAIGVLQNVLQGLDNVGVGAAGADDPSSSPMDNNGAGAGGDQSPPYQDAPPLAPPYGSPYQNRDQGDQPQPPSMDIPNWMLNFMN